MKLRLAMSEQLPTGLVALAVWTPIRLDSPPPWIHIIPQHSRLSVYRQWCRPPTTASSTAWRSKSLRRPTTGRRLARRIVFRSRLGIVHICFKMVSCRCQTAVGLWNFCNVLDFVLLNMILFFMNILIFVVNFNGKSRF